MPIALTLFDWPIGTLAPLDHFRNRDDAIPVNTHSSYVIVTYQFCKIVVTQVSQLQNKKRYGTGMEQYEAITSTE